MSIDRAVEDVAAFHTATDSPTATLPAWPSDERIQLRIDLIEEEVTRETLRGIRERDMVAVSNGIVDSIYVLIGTALEFGIPICQEWDAVQWSNMAKAVEQPDGTRKVVRRPDGKILKPEGWKPPDTEGILLAAGWEKPLPPPRGTFERHKVLGLSCAHCREIESRHEWICSGCGEGIPWDGLRHPAACVCGHAARTLYCPVMEA